jgi:hypothetical protein
MKDFDQLKKCTKMIKKHSKKAKQKNTKVLEWISHRLFNRLFNNTDKKAHKTNDEAHKTWKSKWPF